MAVHGRFFMSEVPLYREQQEDRCVNRLNRTAHGWKETPSGKRDRSHGLDRVPLPLPLSLPLSPFT